MKKNILLQELAVLVLFLLVIFFYFSPLFSGQKLVQGDIVQQRGMAREFIDHAEKEGEYIHWTNTAFGGMPTYLISNRMFQNSNVALWINTKLRTAFPEPSGIVLLSLLAFYFMARTLKISRWTAAIGALVFATATFVLISIEAGHNSKINAYAYSPIILGGLFLLFRKKYIPAIAAIAFGLGGQLAVNHVQITYYTFLICLIYMIYQAVTHIKEGKLLDFAKLAGVSIAAVVIGLGVNFAQLKTTLDYSNETTRGNQSSLTMLQASGQSGLDYEYATQWSLEPAESFSMVIPQFMGGATVEEIENSKFEANRETRGQPFFGYWGEMPSTAGPTYIGTLLFGLFLMSLFLVKGNEKYWIIAASILLLLLSWGKFSPGVFDLFFYNAPFFSKFRTPMMAVLLLTPLLLIPAMRTLDLLTKEDTRRKLPTYFYGLLTLAGIILVFGIAAQSLYDFSGIRDAINLQRGYPDEWISLLKQDRAAMMQSSSFRSLFVLLLGAGILFAFVKEKINKHVFVGLVGLLLVGDLAQVNKRYLNAEDFQDKTMFERSIRASSLDNQIKQDGQSSHYRVLNASTDAFQDAGTSYHHNSIGGYFSAKLRNFQDLLELNMASTVATLDMLNTQYIIQPTEDGGITASKNANALGNAWFVDSVQSATNPDDVIERLATLQPGNSAILLENDAQNVGKIGNASASIRLDSYHPERMVYKANVSGTENRLAVFSEVFYAPTGQDGWRAKINGEDAEHYRANHLLRAIVIPPGESEIEFVFSKKNFKTNSLISSIFSLLLILLVLYFAFHSFKAFKNN